MTLLTVRDFRSQMAKSFDRVDATLSYVKILIS